MVMIRIDSRDKKLENVSENMLVEQIERRRKDGISVSVQIIFKNEDVIIALVTPGHPARGRPIVKPNPKQKKVLDFWRKCSLDREDFQCNDLLFFLRRIASLVS